MERRDLSRLSICMNTYAFFDIDKTIYDGWSTMDFYMFLHSEGIVGDWILERDKEITEQVKSGNMDYAQGSRAVVEANAQCIQGKTVEEVDQLKQSFMNSSRLFEWVEPLCKYLRKENIVIYLVSGSASSAEAVGEYLSVDRCLTSELEIKNGRYTGNVVKMMNYDEKIHTIHRVLGHLKDCLTFGFGDSLGDLAMLESMDEAFVYTPHHHELINIAKQKKWHIVDKDSINKTVKIVLSKYGKK
jgi:HAD superfamily hydrolase (TIGR01490 family)